ncbi:unnamed protein product [Cuscuta epithymum]|uniref:Rhodanese domain-containing protein n=1 Tax=Cuscuta epithymum TaxID=186058 RepID=A0AAV0EX64_9ASTE|nr:unnamed protein product [Cuscuta epithymum]
MGRISIRLFVLKIKRFTAYFSAQVPRKTSNKEEMNRSLEFIKASNLLGPKRLPTVAIVDVRDDERSSDGHIAGSLHFCSETFNANMPRLVHATNGKDTLVFHCAFSQCTVCPSFHKSLSLPVPLSKDTGTKVCTNVCRISFSNGRKR